MTQLHQVARDLWERELLLAHRLKRLRSVAHPGQLLPVDAQTFIPFVVSLLTHHRPPIIDFSAAHQHDSFYSPFQRESHNHVGGRRWIPTQEQLSVLEMLYRGGMRRPNAQQIEQITSQLVKYGRIESKNVFYWFQNQNTRQRKKERLAGIASGHYSKPSSAATTTTSLQMQTSQGDSKERENNGNKRKSRSWLIDLEEEEESNGKEKQRKTLELFRCILANEPRAIIPAPTVTCAYKL